MNTVYALQAENLWSNHLRKDVVKQTIAAAIRFDRKFGSVLADHRLLFRFLPAIWCPVFCLIKEFDWFKLSFAPSDDVDRISFVTLCYDLDGLDFYPTDLEWKLGAMLPRKLKESSLVITEQGPESTDFNFDLNPISEVNKLSLQDALDCDFVTLISSKIQKRNIYKWLMRLLQPEAVMIIALMSCYEEKALPCCEALRLPRIEANKKVQQKALSKCTNCRTEWGRFDFHPKSLIKLPENLLWEVMFFGLKTLVESQHDALPAFLNAPVLNSNGFPKPDGSFIVITGKGIHSIYVLDEDFGLVKSTARAGITMSKLTVLLRLISTVRKINGSASICPKTDFRTDAMEWLDLFVFKSNLRAIALLESAAESLAGLIKFLTESNWDYHPHLADFQKQYFRDFKMRYCADCNDVACPVNNTLDLFIEKMGRLLQLKENRVVRLEDVLNYDLVETFVRRNFDKCDATKVWKSTSTGAGFPKSILFDYGPAKSSS